MNGRRTGSKKGKIFASIRKPTAPPSQKIGPEKNTIKSDPVERKAKHKKGLEKLISDDLQ